MRSGSKASDFGLMTSNPLQWRHNERHGISNHHCPDCLLNYLFRRRSKKTSNLRVTGLCEGNSPVTGEFPAQMASNADLFFIWWRHHVTNICDLSITSVMSGTVSKTNGNSTACPPSYGRQQRNIPQPLIQTEIKENIKTQRHWPLWTGEIPAQMASYAENVSIWWRHHAIYGSPIFNWVAMTWLKDRVPGL